MASSSSSLRCLYRPVLGQISQRVCRKCGSALQTGARAPILTKTYATAREREWSKRMDRYYNDILHEPRKPVPVADPPEPEAKFASFPLTERDKTIEKARVVFGSRLTAPKTRRRELDSQSTRIAGVLVPPRPDEPDNCCMSGCVNCVWDRYRDELEEWAEKSALAREAQRKEKAAEVGSEKQKLRKNIARGSNEPVNVLSMDDDGGGSETLWTGAAADNLPGIGGKDQDDDLFAGIPVGIREFMKTEKRLREQKGKSKEQKQRTAAL